MLFNRAKLLPDGASHWLSVPGDEGCKHLSGYAKFMSLFSRGSFGLGCGLVQNLFYHGARKKSRPFLFGPALWPWCGNFG
jgi:hypothetical protein